jgi:hypothetical protein
MGPEPLKETPLGLALARQAEKKSPGGQPGA